MSSRRKVGEKVQEALLQIVATYIFFIVIITLLFWLIKKAFRNKIVKFVYIFILISPLFLYVPVEFNTCLYSDQFKGVEINTGFNREVIYFKVFSINDKEAKLFYVEGENSNHEMGNFYYFKKDNGIWKFQKWETVWTNLGGSASEFTLPPYF